MGTQLHLDPKQKNWLSHKPSDPRKKDRECVQPLFNRSYMPNPEFQKALSAKKNEQVHENSTSYRPEGDFHHRTASSPVRRRQSISFRLNRANRPKSLSIARNRRASRNFRNYLSPSSKKHIRSDRGSSSGNSSRSIKSTNGQLDILSPGQLSPVNSFDLEDPFMSDHSSASSLSSYTLLQSNDQYCSEKAMSSSSPKKEHIPKITISTSDLKPVPSTASTRLVQMRQHAYTHSDVTDKSLLTCETYIPLEEQGFLGRFLSLFLNVDVSAYMVPIDSSVDRYGKTLGSVLSRLRTEESNDIEKNKFSELSTESSFKKGKIYLGGILYKLGWSKLYVDDRFRITVHPSPHNKRCEFILCLCETLMLYGCPSHKILRNLRVASRILDLRANFLYLPDCMLIYFRNEKEHSDMHFIGITSQIDLNKLGLVNEIYRYVMRDKLSAEDGLDILRNITTFRPLYRKWLVAIMHGLASACILPVAYGGGWYDMPLGFLLGLLLGILRVYLAPKSSLFDKLFEVFGAVVLSFIGRAFGSISKHGRPVFCFTALVEGAVSLILPGYIIFCGVLELQSKNIVSGGVRMLYAVIFSLFLSFGITIGAVLYGWMDTNATRNYSCLKDIGIEKKWYILFIPLYTLSLLFVTQSHPKQWCMQILVSIIGYVVYFYSSLHFGTGQISSALGSFVIGSLGNFYSHFIKSSSFVVVIPAIFVLVPSGFTAQGGVSGGLYTATNIASHNTTTNTTTYSQSGSQYSSLEFGLTMVEIAIGIAVGFFASSIITYPIFGAFARAQARNKHLESI
ncbi:DUF1212 family protein [Schizosaccharomyces octosporus yFS286]|uniref:DUF1212 family protein n=1 Tax=Schizosaccharomyces octosporus (strain yFS286) TaxID=483514 RepID=S9PVC2_SCHOY|nr:DUF1212 family protein [Schizosaccharomyces octosporus yFS286]EPX71443.1 DUF1212 family protein [Schizosaccharomyces octosporus yFS286]